MASSSPPFHLLYCKNLHMRWPISDLLPHQIHFYKILIWPELFLLKTFQWFPIVLRRGESPTSPQQPLSPPQPSSWVTTLDRVACLSQNSQAASYHHATDHTAPAPGHLLPISWSLPPLSPSPAILQDLIYITSAGDLRLIPRHWWGPCTYHVVWEVSFSGSDYLTKPWIQ